LCLLRAALRAYLAAACPSVPTDTDRQVNNPADSKLISPNKPTDPALVAADPEALMNDLAAAPEFSGIALVSLATGAAAKGLSQVALPVTASSSTFKTASEVCACVCERGFAGAACACVLVALRVSWL
jgi:hypothetical protein